MTGKRNPIESVELRVSIRADRETSDRIRQLFPSARARNGGIELKVTGEKPSDVAARAEEMLLKLREAVAVPKGFKNPERSSAQK